MSERKRYCPACDQRTVHQHWKISPMGDRANLAERLLLGVMTIGVSELAMESMCRCLRCGFEREIL